MCRVLIASTARQTLVTGKIVLITFSADGKDVSFFIPASRHTQTLPAARAHRIWRVLVFVDSNASYYFPVEFLTVEVFPRISLQPRANLRLLLIDHSLAYLVHRVVIVVNANDLVSSACNIFLSSAHIYL